MRRIPKWTIWFGLFLFIWMGSAGAGEAPAAAEAAAEVVEAGTDVVVAAAETAEEGGSLAIVGQLVQLALMFLGVPLALLLVGLALKALKKVGIQTDAETQKFLRKQADSVIRQVEVWAAKTAKETKKPKGHEKLSKGIALLSGIVKASNIGNLAADKLGDIIEERLIAKKEKAADPSA